MRALVLLLLVVVSFLLVVKFYPASSVEGAMGPSNEEAVSAQEEQRGFLAREEVPVSTVPEEPSPMPQAVEPRMQRPQDLAPASGDQIPDWLANVDPPEPLAEGELPIAEALIHDSAAEVKREVARHPGFPEARGLLAVSFSIAFEGDAPEGLRLARGIDEAVLSSRERALLQAVLGGDSMAIRPLEASLAESPLVLAMEMLLASREAATLLDARRSPEAARAFSDLLLAELDSPWAPSQELLAGWTESLDLAQGHNRWSTDGEWPGVEVVVQSGDSAIAIRKRYLADNPGRVMSAGLILEANGVSGYLQPGQRLRIPTDPVRMLIDLEARWALYLTGSEVAGSWPVGVGRPGEETPPGEYIARDKLVEPPWMRVGHEPVPFGDPRNPLGTRWIGWYVGEEHTSYGFHGTKEPDSVGKASSDGCIRFNNDSVERLFEILPEGSPILVRE